MKIAIVINAKRLSEELKSQLADPNLAAKYDMSFDVYAEEPQLIEKRLRQLNTKTYNALIIGGGDGTVRTAAQVLSGEDIPLAILPLGTFNVLAKDLNHPNDIEAILAMVKNNKTKKIDVAEANGLVFINHAWIGFYSHILKLREKYKNTLRRSKLLKILFNLSSLFKPLPIYSVEIISNHKKINYKTCLIYISNNDHYTNLLDFGERKTLSSGLLSISVLNCQTKMQLYRCIFSILCNRFKQSKYVTQFTTDTFTIRSQLKMIRIVLDGELITLETPLHFRNFQKKLTVVVP